MWKTKISYGSQGGGGSGSQESSEERHQNLKGNDTNNSISSVAQGTGYVACSVIFIILCVEL